jgi:hypothetical protein
MDGIEMDSIPFQGIEFFIFGRRSEDLGVIWNCYSF